MSTKEKIFGIILVMIIITINYLSSNSKLEIDKNISNNKYTTICKVYKITSGRGFTHIYYLYYFKGKEYESWTNADDFGNNNLNKFYKVNLSTKNPKYSNIILNQEVKDKNEIIKLGLKYN